MIPLKTSTTSRLTMATCSAPNCKCRARLDDHFCGRHAPRCIVGGCRKASMTGGAVCRFHAPKVTCEICYEEVLDQDMCHLNLCTHSFCNGCIKKWMNSGRSMPKCPMCRSYIARTAKDLVEIIHDILARNLAARYPARVQIVDELFRYLATPFARAILPNTFWDACRNKLAHFETEAKTEEEAYISKWKQMMHFLY